MKSAQVSKVLSLLPALLALTSACSVKKNSIVTFYGFPDNSPPGAGTAHDCGGRNNIAGGSGTFADPLTFATAQGEYDPCEIVYLPLLKKYLRFEDDCAQCETDNGNGQAHIDIWTGSSTQDGGQDQISCEDNLTSGGTYEVVRQPADSYDVDDGELYQSGNCGTSHVHEDQKAAQYCSGTGEGSCSR